jgi:glucose-1-phosphate adenylyltransferase
MKGDDVVAVIMGGGRGSRLYPLTADRSKPAVPLAGKYRLVDIPISNCINSGIQRMYVLTQFNSASLNAHIKNTYHFSFFSSAFVEIHAAEQTMDSEKWFQGTADAVRQTMPRLLKQNFKYALILSGDQLYQMDFTDMLDAHIKAKADFSIATLPVTAREATSYGILKSDNENIITSFIEKPHSSILNDWISPVSGEMQSRGREYLASMGIYIFNREVLIDLLNNPNTMDFGKEVIPQNIDHYNVLSYPFEGYWTDIGNVASFFEANLDLTDDIPKFDLYSNVNRIYTRARILPTTKISGTELEHAVIAEGCIIHAKYIERSVIGIRSRIGNKSTVINTYMMGCDYYQTLDDLIHEGRIPMGIGENTYIKNAILDKNCCIGNDVKIEGGPHLDETETDLYCVREGIVVIKKGAVIPNGFSLG